MPQTRLTERIGRVAKTQLGVLSGKISDALPEKPMETHTLDFRMGYPSRSRIGQAVRRGHVWDDHLRLLVASLAPDPLVLEVGSNIGASMLTMVSVRSDLNMICFEPSERYFRFLQENIQRNELGDRVEARQLLIGPATPHALHINDTTASVAVADYDGHHHITDEMIQGVPLDDCVPPGKQVAVIKVDTDGYELAVLRSAQRILAESSPLLAIEYSPRLLDSAGSSAPELLNFVRNAGYRRAEIRHPSGALVERSHPLDLELPGPTSEYWDLLLHP